MRFLLWGLSISIFLPFFATAQTAQLDSLKQILIDAPKDTQRLRLLFEIMDGSMFSDAQQTLEKATEALSLAEKLEIDSSIMRAHYGIGVGHYFSGEFNASITHVKEATQYAELVGTSKNIIDCYNLQGSIYEQLSATDSALVVIYKALNLAEEVNNRSRIITALANLGRLFLINKEEDRAKINWLQALKISLEDKDSLVAATMYNNLATITSDSDSALNYLENALTIFKNSNHMDGIGHTTLNIGSEYFKQDQYSKAIPYFLESIEIWKNPATNFKPGLVNAYMNMGSSTGMLDQTAESEQWFAKALALADSLENTYLKKDIFEIKSELYEKKQQTAKALESYKVMVALQDTLFSEEKAEELAESETRYQTAKKEVELSEKELTIAKQKSNQKNILLFSLVIFLALIGLFQYFRNRQSIRQKEAELALQIEKSEAEKLRELDHLRSNFFTNISHEFRTPLTLILTPLQQFLSPSPLSVVSVERKYLKMMHRNAGRLLDLINQLLDLAKLESGNLRLQAAPGDIAQFIRAIAYSFESLATRKQIQYIVEVSNEPIETYFDQDKLEKILTNLLSNAFKFTPEEGSITLKAWKKATQKELVIEVQDKGIGIPENQVPYIFNRFYQAASNNDLQASSGVGLTLTKELVELHHGTINFSSQVDEGTTFTVCLPLGKEYLFSKEIVEVPITTSLQKQASVFSPETERKLSIPKVFPDNRPLILVVEDNEDVRLYITDQLKETYQVIEAGNGRLGLEQALERIPDLILTDVMMPEMDGTELSIQLRGNEKTSHIPIIMLTAKAEQEDKIAGLEIGVDDYLSQTI